MKGFRYVAMLGLVLVGSLALAAGPYSISVGTGDGSLSFSQFYSTGYIDGDDATFNPGGGVSANTSVWNGCWCLSSAGSLLGWADTGFTVHTEQIVDGTITPGTPTGNFTNTGMTLPGNGSITADLAVNFSNPTASDTAEVEWVWTVYNAGASAVGVTIVGFLDVDTYFSGVNYDANMVALTDTVDDPNYTVQNPLGAIAMGNPSGSNVDLNLGVLFDCNVTPAAVFAISDSLGSSYYWSSSSSFAGNGPESTGYEIKTEFKNTVQNDANTDYLADTGNDVGGVIQVNLLVPASGNASATFTATWGLNDTVGGGEFTPPPAEVGTWYMF